MYCWATIYLVPPNNFISIKVYILGIYTGAVYQDESLQKGGFKGEGRIDGSVVVVTTHYSRYQIKRDNRHLDKVKLVFRNCQMSGFRSILEFLPSIFTVKRTFTIALNDGNSDHLREKVTNNKKTLR